jgi:hypothetical protein
MATDTVTTDQPITGGGIRSVNFFNGRLLTGEDLTREQEANQLARLRLGRAVGSGVAYGLEVSVAPSATNERPVLHVEAGVAVNRRGRVLELAAATEVSLAREPAPGAAAEVLFKECTPIQPGTYSAGAGLYLLSIAPAEATDGRAKVSGLGNEDAVCNTAFSIEGVQFQLLRLAVPASFLDAPARLRNRVAHLMLGTADERRLALSVDPLGLPVGEYGLLDDLRATNCLDDEQVPLAVLAWTAAGGVRFVDLWSVRRRIVTPAADTRYPVLVGDRRRAEAEAAFLQFQDQIGDLLTAGGSLPTVTAAERFEFLPPVGIVPILGAGSVVGFDADVFLGDQGSDELATTDAALVPALVRESLAHDPIAVGTTERVQRYLVWENELAVERGAVGRRALVFAKRTLPYRGIARYGRARFGRSRFAPSVI